MKLAERFRYAWRAWRLGPAAGSPLGVWGLDSGHFTAPEYGGYIATSGAVYTCATMRAQALASLPLRVIRNNKERMDGNLYELLQRVNPFWTLSRLIEMTELSLCTWGQAFWTLERGNAGRNVPVEIWWARSDRMVVIPDRTNYIAGFEYHGPTGESIKFTPGEVLWLRYPNPLDEHAGLSPLAAAKLAADVARAGAKSNQAIFDNALAPGALISPKQENRLWTPEQAEQLQTLLEARLRGADKRHRVLILREAVNVVTPTLSPKDAEFLGALKWSLEEVCRAYKVPLDLVGGQRTYDNYRSALQAFWSQCIEPEARFIANELTEQLVPMFPGEADRVEFDLSGIAALQEAEGERWARAQGQIAAGALTINEWRGKMGLGKVPWGDVWWAPGGVTPVSSAAIAPAAEVARALRTRKWVMPRRVSVSGVRDKAGTEKNKSERELAEDIAILLALLAARVKASLGEPPNIDNVPAAVWGEYERRLRDTIRPALERVGEAVLEEAIEEAGLDPDGPEASDIADDLDDWARKQAAQSAKELIETTKSQTAEGLARWAAAGAEGDAWDSIARWYEDERAGVIASDSVTDAALMAILLLSKRTRRERIWHTQQDERVCGLCAPLDGLPESRWPAEIEGRAFDGERLHPHCRCWVTLERV